MTRDRNAFAFSRKTSASRQASGVSVFETGSALALVAAAILGIFFVSPFATLVHDFPKSIGFTIFTFLAFVLWLAGRIANPRPIVFDTRIAQGLLIIAVVSLVVTVFGNDPFSALFGNPGRAGFPLVVVFAFLLFLFLVPQSLRSETLLRRTRIALGGGLALLFLVFLARTFLPLPFVFGRAGLSLLSSSPDELAVVAAAAIGLCLSSLAAGERPRFAVAGWGLLGALAFSVVLFVGAPRAWFALLAASALVVLQIYRRGSGFKNFWRALPLFLLLVSIPLAFFGTPRYVRLALPIEPGLTLQESWTLTRDFLSSGVREFLLGGGFGSYPTAFGAHRPDEVNLRPIFSALTLRPAGSLFLSLIEGGILFAASLLLLVVFMLRKGFLLWREVLPTLQARLPLVARRKGSEEGSVFFGWSLFVAMVSLLVGSIHTVPSYGFLAFSVVILSLFLAATSLRENQELELPPFLRNLFNKRSPRIAATGVVSLILLVVSAHLARTALAEAYFGQGVRAFAAGREADAAAYAQTAHKVLPSDGRYPLGVAQSLLAQENGDRAREQEILTALKEAERLGSPHVEYWISLAHVARALAPASEEARAILRNAALRAEVLEPENPMLKVFVADVLGQSGDVSGALERYAIAATLRPSFGEALEHWSMLLAEYGDFAMQNGNLPEAREAFSRLLQLQPGSDAVRERVTLIDAELARTASSTAATSTRP